MAQIYEYQDIDAHVILLFVHPAKVFYSPRLQRLFKKIHTFFALSEKRYIFAKTNYLRRKVTKGPTFIADKHICFLRTHP